MMLRWLSQRSDRSSSALDYATGTGTPFVRIVISLSISRKPLASPKYWRICVGSTGGAVSLSPIERATSPTAPPFATIRGENTWKCGELKLYFSPSAGG